MLLKSRASPDMFYFSPCNKKNVQFGTWTDPSFQRHYRFRYTTSGCSLAKDLSAPPCNKSLVLVTDKIYCSRRNWAAAFTTNHEQSFPLLLVTVDLPVAASSS
jgi:hypothetical protein